MSKQFWIFLALGLVIVGIFVSTVVVGNKGSHLELTGVVLKIRVLALNSKASLVTADFRVTNPSNVPFVVRGVEMKLDQVSGDPLDGTPISKPDMENVFKYDKLIGPKFNDVLSISDKIGPHQRLDRMVGARFELPESKIDDRKAIRLVIEDLDGTVAEIVEKK